MDDVDTRTLDAVKALVLDATSDARVSADLATGLLRMRRRARRLRATGLAAVILTIAGGAVGGVIASERTSTSRLSPIGSVKSQSPPSPKGAAARIESITLPEGYGLWRTETSPVPTGTTAKITSVDNRYTPGGLAPASPKGSGGGELHVALQTGDVSPPDLTTLKNDEPTAHDVPLRPGMEVILVRDASAAGGLTYYMWFENGIYIEVTAIGGTVPDLARVVSSIRVSS